MARRKRGMAALRCNNCEHGFQGRVWHIVTETKDNGILN